MGDWIHCEESNLRNALNNRRILTWIIVGWCSVIIHLVLSILMRHVIDPEYEYSSDKLKEEIMERIEEWKEEYAQESIANAGQTTIHVAEEKEEEREHEQEMDDQKEAGQQTTTISVTN